MPTYAWDDLPHPVEEIEHFQITLSDGTCLAARRWQPRGADARPVPAILEYIPYRKRDKTAHRDGLSHPYVAGHGYASVRVDLRGSGESDGVLTDEYLQQELDDGLEVIAWIAAQPWCDGRVGMIGKSWGGFNGLQLAALRPPALGAIVTVCSTDDRYADDVHYMGGCLLSDNLSWASSMFANISCPPDPALVGDRWRELWRERLEGSGLWLETWLEHQHRDDYWKHGSVGEDMSAIQVPVLAVSGWADGYSNSVFRLVAELDEGVPRRGLVGPWSHKYPHLGVPGPAIGFLQECVRWWDRWLKGVDNGLDDEPQLLAWMQDPIPPALDVRVRPGRWVSEPSWPSAGVEERVLGLGDAGLFADVDDTPNDARLHTISSPMSLGLYAGKWASFTATPDLPMDQREEDGGSLNFDSTVLDEPLEILGAPVVELELSVDQPVAMVAVRLSDRLPDDSITRVTYGLKNLCHRDSDEHPEPLVPGQRYRVRVQLNEVAHRFEAGHRLRLQISTSYWPVAWPSPAPVRLTVDPAASRLMLPVREPRPDEEAALRPFEDPEGSEPPTQRQLVPRDYGWWVIRDLVTTETAVETRKDEGTYRLEDIDLDVRSRTDERYSYLDDDPTTARGEVTGVRRFTRGSWDVRTVTHTVLTCTAEEFRIRATLDAYEGETRVAAKSWDRTIPRRLL
jgi:putative CocE/NonD family hydrolase